MPSGHKERFDTETVRQEAVRTSHRANAKYITEIVRKDAVRTNHRADANYGTDSVPKTAVRTSHRARTIYENVTKTLNNTPLRIHWSDII